jgi:PIN domain nuclease of toxin-antitoxin system
VDAGLLRRGLLDNGYGELLIAGNHAAATAHLPPLHRDPFDRLLIAQALAEGVLLLTSDEMVARYPGPVRLV